MSKPKTQTVIFMNDTGEDVEVRLNIANTPPTGFVVEPGKAKLMNMRSTEIFVKLWKNNTILFQDRGIVVPEVSEKGEGELDKE